jgi:hypothetical protein
MKGFRRNALKQHNFNLLDEKWCNITAKKQSSAKMYDLICSDPTDCIVHSWLGDQA